MAGFHVEIVADLAEISNLIGGKNDCRVRPSVLFFVDLQPEVAGIAIGRPQHDKPRAG